MDKPTVAVLLIEDSAVQARAVEHLLAHAARVTFAVQWAQSLAAGLRLLASESFDVVLTDLQLHDSYGIDTFQHIQDQSPDIPVVILTNLEDDVVMLEAIGAGAQDYRIKSQVDAAGLEYSLRFSIARQALFNALRSGYEAEIARLGGQAGRSAARHAAP